MEFDEALALLQGAISSLGNQGLLNKEDSLQDAVGTLGKIVMTLPEDVKQRAVFFMVLNSDLSISEELEKDEFVGLFTKITPPIKLAYLVKYAYHLNLQQPLFKVIENCRGNLGIELMDAILKELEDPSFHKDEFGLEHFYDLWRCVFVKICKISNGLHANENLQKFMSYFNRICDLIQKILVTCMKMKGLENTAGIHLYSYFKTFLFFLKLSRSLDLCDDPLYKLSVELKLENAERDESSIKACIDLIFKDVVNILDNLTVGLWMTLSESSFEFDRHSSVQALLGGLFYSILHEAVGFTVSPEVMNCLSRLALDRLTSATLEEVISNVRSGKKEWFEALVKHPGVTESESVKCLIENISLATPNDLNTILTMAHRGICKPDGCTDLMKNLFLTAVVKSPDYPKWLKIVLDEKLDLSTARTQFDLTETFNKMSREVILVDELKSLCIQSPSETIKKVCHLAISGSLPLEDVINMLRLIQQPCTDLERDGPACLDCVVFKGLALRELTHKEEQRLIILTMQLGKEALLGPFSSRKLLRSMKDRLEKTEIQEVVVSLQMLKTLLELKLLDIDRIVVLAFLSKVLENLTWDFSSFSTAKADGRDLTVYIVSVIMDEIDGKETDEGCAWARNEILTCYEMNQACFCDLWFRFGRSWPFSGSLTSCILALAHSRHRAHDLTDFLVNLGDPADARASIVLSVTTLLPVVTYRELCSIFDALLIVSMGRAILESDVYELAVDLLGSALYLLTVSLLGRTSFPCFKYCLRNFGRLTRQIWPKMTGEGLAHNFERIFFLLGAIEGPEDKQACLTILLPVMLQLIEWMKKRNALYQHRSALRNMAALLGPSDVSRVLARWLY